MLVMVVFFQSFFFQAEDGIRDRIVTGVQTCALPISACSTQEMNTLSSTRRSMSRAEALSWNPNWSVGDIRVIEENLDRLAARTFFRTRSNRSEERRVGKEGRSARPP